MANPSLLVVAEPGYGLRILLNAVLQTTTSNHTDGLSTAFVTGTTSRTRVLHIPTFPTADTGVSPAQATRAHTATCHQPDRQSMGELRPPVDSDA